MKARVIVPYTDRETLQVALAGSVVDLSEARLSELAGGGYVEPVAAGTKDNAHTPDLGDMTAAELRGYIDSAGATYHRSDTKARLLSIARGL